MAHPVGHVPWNKGKRGLFQHSEEWKRKVGDLHRGKTISQETRDKISLAKTGKKTGPFSEETRKRMSEARKGWKMTEEAKHKLSEFRKTQVGAKSPAWKGGVTPIHISIRNSIKMKAYTLDVMRRDRFCCQECGDDRGGNLEVDHIVPFTFLVGSLREKVGIGNLYIEAMKYGPLWDLANGRTLCVVCHRKTSTYGNKAKKYHAYV